MLTTCCKDDDAAIKGRYYYLGLAVAGDIADCGRGHHCLTVAGSRSRAGRLKAGACKWPLPSAVSAGSSNT